MQLFEVGMFPLFLLYGVRMPLQQRLMEIARKITDEQGAELIDVDVKGSSGGYLFLVYADTDAGISLGECVKLSRAIQDEIDIEEGFPERYRLEVSSPGLTRPLTTDFQLKKNIGKAVTVSFKDNEGKTKKMSGKLISFSEEKFELKLEDGKKQSLVRDQINTIKIKLQW